MYFALDSAELAFTLLRSLLDGEVVLVSFGFEVSAELYLIAVSFVGCLKGVGLVWICYDLLDPKCNEEVFLFFSPIVYLFVFVLRSG